MRKTKHYWGRNRKQRGLRRSWPRWLYWPPITFTWVENYSPKVVELMEKWAAGLIRENPVTPPVCLGLDTLPVQSRLGLFGGMTAVLVNPPRGVSYDLPGIMQQFAPEPSLFPEPVRSVTWDDFEIESSYKIDFSKLDLPK